MAGRSHLNVTVLAILCSYRLSHQGAQNFLEELVMYFHCIKTKTIIIAPTLYITAITVKRLSSMKSA